MFLLQLVSSNKWRWSSRVLLKTNNWLQPFFWQRCLFHTPPFSPCQKSSLSWDQQLQNDTLFLSAQYLHFQSLNKGRWNSILQESLCPATTANQTVTFQQHPWKGFMEVHAEKVHVSQASAIPLGVGIEFNCKTHLQLNQQQENTRKMLKLKEKKIHKTKHFWK